MTQSRVPPVGRARQSRWSSDSWKASSLKKAADEEIAGWIQLGFDGGRDRRGPEVDGVTQKGALRKGCPTYRGALRVHRHISNPGWIGGRGRLEGRGFSGAETASSETDCTRDSGTDPAANRNRAYKRVP